MCQPSHKDTKTDNTVTHAGQGGLVCVLSTLQFSSSFFLFFPHNSNDREARGKMMHEKEEGESGTAPMGGFKSNRGHRAEPGA